MASRFEDTGISPTSFIIGTAAFLVGVGAVIWFAIPGVDARYKFASPSGREVIELGEQCREAGCQRVAIRETVAPDGSKTRRGCDFEILQQHPMLLNAYPLWAPDERSVAIVYADADGIGGKVELDLDRDCTLTE